MKIGNVKVNGMAALAPMAGLTDRAFREICAKHSASYLTSEMISTKGLIYKSKKTFELTSRSKKETPFAIQLFGNDPKDFEKATSLLLPLKPDIIDVNMGCPAPKIVKEGSGSALMQNPQLCADIVKAIKSVTDIPVTIKIRSGWNASALNAVEVAQTCEKAGANAITVHGRTRDQMYSGTANLDIIKNVKESTGIPIVGNGDVTSVFSAEHMINYTGCDLVAIGRGAIGNPWIFNEINSWFTSKKSPAPPEIKEKIKVMKIHIKKICKYKGDTRGIKEIKNHIAGYINGIPCAAEYRKKAYFAESKQDLINLFQEIERDSLNA